jgi:hypothetical protein
MTSERTFDLPDGRLMKANLLAIYDAATPAERDTGEQWYSVAYTFARGLGARYKRTTAEAAGIIAALSPGCSWERNMALADMMMQRGDCRHSYGAPINKARAIWTGASPGAVLKGPKERNFYGNILEPDSADFLTIDRHAVSILMGRKVESLPQRKGYYERCARIYTEVAFDLHIYTPNQLQATTWLAWRRLNPAARWAKRMHPQLDLDWE